MSGESTIKRSGIPQRIKNIMSKVNENFDVKLFDSSIDSNKTRLKTGHEKENIQNTNTQKDIRSLVDSLYAREYSMSSEVFKFFCETQTTATSHHLNDINNIIYNLKKAPISSDISQLAKKNTEENSILFCEETLLSSPISTKSNQDFDSDDSVKDKDYNPTENGHKSDDTSGDDNYVQTKKPRIMKKCSGTKFIRKTKPLRRHSLTTTTTNPSSDSFLLRRRRMTIDSTLGAGTSSLHETGEIQESNNLLPKRRKYTTSLKERKLVKLNQKLNKYKIKDGCNDKCLKKCCTLFTTTEREEINKKYWNMTYSEKRVFINSHYTVAIPKRKYVTELKRRPRRCFSLQKTDGTLVSVCKIFFLTTLGYEKFNDKVLINCLNPDKNIDRRGKHVKTPKFDREILTSHVESFNPSAPHYRREHAPNRRYLPSEININFMYKDFCAKHPDLKIGYEMYRLHLKIMNVSFTRLGNEECELCESYKFHTRDTNHDARNEIAAGCDICVVWSAHHEKYNKARQLYDSHKTIGQNEDHIYYSSDLEKVIMLPRLESFKAVIFCPRLTAYNQTFAPVGKITKDSKPIAAIWHDGIAGRKQEDIMSAYYNFFLHFRDVKTIHLWMDNCTSQNKNWLFFSMLVGLVNSNVIATDRIILFYFEPGHTYMSCDQFHHQVELAMKKKNKIYDFIDFEDAVSSANNGKVVLKSLHPQNFINYPNNVSDRRIQNANPRPYLKNMSEVCFIRSSFDLRYKNKFDDDYITLKFLNDKYLKNPQFTITFRTLPKGIDEDRKKHIITKLSTIIPTHKMIFWNNLTTNDKDSEAIEQKNSRKRVTQ